MFQKRKEMEMISAAIEDLINGQPLESNGFYQDTLPAKVHHQLLRLSEKIRGTEEKAQRDRDEIKELITEIAHQLRNPLANMEGYLELLSDKDSSEKDREFYLQALQESEARIRFLTEGFIKMARLERNIIQIKKETADLTATVLASLLQAGAGAEEKGITFSFEGEEGIYVEHDPNWLGEAVYNLLDNSVKYSGEESKIQVKVFKNEMFAQIQVRDFGIGMEPEEANLIFQRFYRGKNASGRPGFGLGLYLTREIVMLHGGFVKAKEKQKGMQMSIFLPV